MHVHHTLLTAVDRGEMPRDRLEEVLYEHLATFCPTCAGQVLEAEARRSRPGLLRHLEPRDPLKRLARRLGLKEVELRKHETKARAWVRKVVKLPPEERWGRVFRAHSNYRGSIFCHLLLEEARGRIPGDPAEALSLAETALTANHKGGGDYPVDAEIQAAGLAVRGNAKRALGRLGAAHVDLEEAEEFLDAPGVTEWATAAEVHWYLGALRKDQDRLEESIQHHHRSTMVYGLLGKYEAQARVMLSLAIVDYLRHDFQAAVANGERALELLDDGSPDWLRIYAHVNLAQFRHAAGDLDRAEAELDARPDLLASAGDEVAQYVVWLQARIAWSRGELPAAKRRFTEARKRARELGQGYDAGLITLELALVHLAEGRPDRVKALAQEAQRTFAREECVERETRAALELLEAAARREALDRAALERAVATLEQARHRRPAAHVAT